MSQPRTQDLVWVLVTISYDIPLRPRWGVYVSLYLFFNLGNCGRLEVSAMVRSLYLRKSAPLPFVQEAGWVSGLLWMHRDSLVPSGLWTLDHPACSKPLYQSYYHGYSPLWYDSAVFPNLHLIYTPLTSDNSCVYRWSWTSNVFLIHWARHKSLVCTGTMEDKGTLNKNVLYLPSASRTAACKLCVVKMMIVSSSYILCNSRPVSFFPQSKNLFALFLILNTFTAIVDLIRFNSSCLQSPASTLVDLIFQLRALLSFSLNQLCDLSV